MAGESVRDSLEEAWSKLQTHWQGEDAAAFRGSVFLPMAESAERLETLCRALDEAAEELSQRLSEWERSGEDQRKGDGGAI